MTVQRIKDDLNTFINTIQIINTHSHHLPDVENITLDLIGILKNSHLYSDEMNLPQNKIQRRAFLKKYAHNSYFYWLEKALREIYDISSPIDEINWEKLDKSIKKAHKDENHHINILEKRCKYDYLITDPYWHPGNAQGHKGYFRPSFTVDMFFVGYSYDIFDHNANNAYLSFQIPKDITFDNYLEIMKSCITSKKHGGCVAIKSGLAHTRSLAIREVSKHEAAKAFLNPSATKEDILNFQDYIFYELCSIASELNMPFQIHSGFSSLQNTNALQLSDAIRKNPSTKFVFLHGNFPWANELIALVHSYQNVYVDLSQMPLTSSTICERFLHEMIEVGDKYKLTWGCNTLTSEESYAALLATKKILLNVFTKLVANRTLTFNGAKNYIEHIMRENAKLLYRIK